MTEDPIYEQRRMETTNWFQRLCAKIARWFEPECAPKGDVFDEYMKLVDQYLDHLDKQATQFITYHGDPVGNRLRNEMDRLYAVMTLKEREQVATFWALTKVGKAEEDPDGFDNWMGDPTKPCHHCGETNYKQEDLKIGFFWVCQACKATGMRVKKDADWMYSMETGQRVDLGEKVREIEAWADQRLAEAGFRFCPICDTNVKVDENGNCCSLTCGGTYDYRPGK